MTKWKFVENGPNDCGDPDNPWVVWELDEKQQPIPHAGYRYWHEKTAVGYARFLVDHGHNVIVFKEIGHCIAEYDDEG